MACGEGTVGGETPPSHTPGICSLNIVKKKRGRFHSGLNCHSRKRAATVKLGGYSLHLREEKMHKILQINRICSHKARMLRSCRLAQKAPFHLLANKKQAIIKRGGAADSL